MSTTELMRESWATRYGFILAAVGSAVGLGNIWRFPFQTGQEGGAAFLVMYLLFVILIGFPAMLVEFVIGRRTERNPVGALVVVGGGAWKYLGGFFVLTGFIILSYYSVVGGWVLRYIVGSASGAYMNNPGQYFGSIASGTDAVAFHALFMLLVIGIVALGVRQGIELGVKIMVPAIYVLLVGLAIYVSTLPNAFEGYAYYLSPDVNVIMANWTSIVPAAAGQALFTLSLGMGVMITYASYLSEDDNLGIDGGSIVALNTLVSIIAGLVVFPILFTAGTDPATSGAGAVFVSLAGALADIPLGNIIGLVFFVTLAIAALSSAISLLEVVMSYLIDEHEITRRPGTIAIGVLIFLFGIPAALDLNYLSLYDSLSANILLVFGALMLTILVGWLAYNEALEELQKGVGDLGWYGDAWVWLVRIPVIIVLIVSLYLGVNEYIEFVQTTFL